MPAGASVARAVLVWGILYSAPTPPNTITFAGKNVTADITPTVSGTLCWDNSNTIGYAADVTGSVSGNGDYAVTNPPNGSIRPDSDPNGTLPFTDGASLVVFYTGGGANNQVLSDFSYDTDTDTDPVIHRAFSGISSVGGTSSLILAGPDGQNNGGETFTITGSDPQSGPSFPIGNLWDTDQYDVSSVLPAGQTTLAFDVGISGECIGVGAAVLQVAQ